MRLPSLVVSLVLSTAIALSVQPAAAVPPVEPTTTLQPKWSIPAPGSMTGALVWARTPGVFPTADSARIFSALGRRNFTGRVTCDDTIPGVPSVVQAIDARTGAVVSTITPQLPNGAPISRFAMDDSARRMVVFSGVCPAYIWNTLDAATGELLARWESPASHLPLQFAMGPDADRVYIVDWVDGTVAGYPDYRVQSLDSLTGRVLWSTSIGEGPWADFGADTSRQYQSQRLAVSADGGLLYVIPSSRSEVVVLETTSGQVSGRIRLPDSADLRTIAVSPVSPRAFVTDWSNNVIRIIDTDTLAVSGDFAVPGRCLESMDIDATGDRLAVLVACDSPRTILMSTSDGSVLAEAPAQGDASEIRMLPDGTGLIIRRKAELAGSAITQSLPATRPAKKARPVPAPLPPRAIGVLTASTSARVSWRPPANAKSAKVTGYRVVTRPGGASCTVKATVTACALRNLAPGRRYVFSVEARNAAGWGLPARSPVIALPAPPPPIVQPPPEILEPPSKPTQPIS